MEDGFTEGESESVQECLEAALGSDLTGTEFIDFLLNCLCSHGIGCP
jgi:hypothetical protein